MDEWLEKDYEKTVQRLHEENKKLKKEAEKMKIDFEEIRKELLKNASKEQIKEIALYSFCMEAAKEELNKRYGKKGIEKNEL